MADAAPATASPATSSTAAASPTAAAPATDATAAPAATLYPTDPVKPVEPQKSSEPVKPTTSAAPAVDPAQPATTVPDPLAWTMPEDFKPPESTVTKFMSAIQSATKDGKFEVTPQMMVDTYVELARDANTAWQKQIETLDATNKATCQSRFTREQLAASESAVGWFSSYEPGFKDFAQRQLNDPTFVNAMRLVGEALQEEEFIPAAPPGPAKRTPAQVMGYDKPKN